MPDEKEDSRLKRNRRRSSEDLEKGKRRAAREKIVRAESKLNSARQQLDLRITKLLNQGYSKASIAKRLAVTPRRIDLAVDSASRQ
jgi:hypothetical protein